MQCRVPKGLIPATHCCENLKIFMSCLSVQTVLPFCFDYEFADVLRLSMFADIFITSAGCLAVNSVSVVK
jgi:hypothetical protein